MLGEPPNGKQVTNLPLADLHAPTRSTAKCGIGVEAVTFLGGCHVWIRIEDESPHFSI